MQDDIIKLDNAKVYATPKALKSTDIKSGEYYQWDDKEVNNRIRITSSKNNIGKPGCIVGWIDKKDELSGEIIKNKVYSSGDEIELVDTPIYKSSSAEVSNSNANGTYYIWGKDTANGRIRITNQIDRVGKSNSILGWIEVSKIQ